jgi:hypothetical protein
MMNTGHSIGGRRSFIKDKRGSPFPGSNAFLEDISGIPEIQNSLSNRGEIQFFVFLEFYLHPEGVPYFSKKCKINEFKDNPQAIRGGNGMK